MSAILARIDARIAELQAARRVLVELEGDNTGAPVRESKRITKLRAKLSGSSGTSAVVLAAIKGGADTLAAIAKDAKVKVSTARSAILALEEAGHVVREGKGRSTRYQRAK